MRIPGAPAMEISQARPEDVAAISETLAGAFHDDPVFAWATPDPVKRRMRLPRFFALFAEMYLSHQESYLAGGGAGVALWAPPGATPIPEEEAHAFGERMVTLLEEDAERAAQIDALLEQHHPAAPCFYLQFMGVSPAHQGRGLGSGLLTTVLQRCDSTGTPAYLEATSLSNRRLYARHGFETVNELTLPQGPPLWPMWREPASA